MDYITVYDALKELYECCVDDHPNGTDRPILMVTRTILEENKPPECHDGEALVTLVDIPLRLPAHMTEALKAQALDMIQHDGVALLNYILPHALMECIEHPEVLKEAKKENEDGVQEAKKENEDDVQETPTV